MLLEYDWLFHHQEKELHKTYLLEEAVLYSFYAGGKDGSGDGVVFSAIYKVKSG